MILRIIEEFFKGIAFISGIVIALYLLVRYNPLGIGEFISAFMIG